MNNPRYRKYPRAYKKADTCDTQSAPQNNAQAALHKEEKSIVLSLGTAVGILAAAFLNGMILGCILKRKIT